MVSIPLVANVREGLSWALIGLDSGFLAAWLGWSMVVPRWLCLDGEKGRQTTAHLWNGQILSRNELFRFGRKGSVLAKPEFPSPGESLKRF
jgi:hypothetical protein